MVMTHKSALQVLLLASLSFSAVISQGEYMYSFVHTVGRLSMGGIRKADRLES